MHVYDYTYKYVNIRIIIYTYKRNFLKICIQNMCKFCKNRFRYSLFPQIAFTLASLSVKTILRQFTRRVSRQNCPLNDKLLDPEGEGIMFLRGVSHYLQMEKT